MSGDRLAVLVLQPDMAQFAAVGDVRLDNGIGRRAAFHDGQFCPAFDPDQMADHRRALDYIVIAQVNDRTGAGRLKDDALGGGRGVQRCERAVDLFLACGLQYAEEATHDRNVLGKRLAQRGDGQPGLAQWRREIRAEPAADKACDLPGQPGERVGGSVARLAAIGEPERRRQRRGVGVLPILVAPRRRSGLQQARAGSGAGFAGPSLPLRREQAWPRASPRQHFSWQGQPSHATDLRMSA